MLSILWGILTFPRRKIFPGFRVDVNALVLNVGSGNKPFWRGDFFVDLLDSSNNQRHSGGKLLIIKDRIINANVEELPFCDKIFDFCFCSHLLEHVENPARAISEIVRVSKAGYIEVPNGIHEIIQPFNSHLWVTFLMMIT